MLVRMLFVTSFVYEYTFTRGTKHANQKYITHPASARGGGLGAPKRKRTHKTNSQLLPSCAQNASLCPADTNTFARWTKRWSTTGEGGGCCSGGTNMH